MKLTKNPLNYKKGDTIIISGRVKPAYKVELLDNWSQGQLDGTNDHLVYVKMENGTLGMAAVLEDDKKNTPAHYAVGWSDGMDNYKLQVLADKFKCFINL